MDMLLCDWERIAKTTALSFGMSGMLHCEQNVSAHSAIILITTERGRSQSKLFEPSLARNT